MKVTANDPSGKLADAELHVTAGPLVGLKLIGFGIWARRGGNGRNVTFPARQYSVNGERRSFALLRPLVDVSAQDRVTRSDSAGLRGARSGLSSDRVTFGAGPHQGSGRPYARKHVAHRWVRSNCFMAFSTASSPAWTYRAEMPIVECPAIRPSVHGSHLDSPSRVRNVWRQV